MKVSFCAGWDIEKDGIADYSRYFTRELEKLNIEINFISLRPYVNEGSFYRELADKANAADLCHVQFNYVYFNGELPYRNRFYDFAKYIKIPLIMTAHEVRVGYKPEASGMDNKIKKVIFNKTLFLWNLWSVYYHKKMYGRADRIYAHTKGQARMIKSLVRDPDKVVILPHGIPDVSAQDRNVAVLQAKNELGLEDKFVLGIFGFINTKKGYELVLDILGALPENVILLIAGGPMTDNAVDKGYYNSLIKRISEAGLEKRVRITGYLKQADIPKVMAATDICLAPFLSASASGALSLCIAYRKPIIASDIPVHKEVFERIPCVELFRYPDSRELLNKIKALLADPGRIIELSLLAKEYSCRFSYAEITRETARTYEDMLSVHNNGN